MKTDRYTQVVLTVIAICLCALTFKCVGLVSPANATGSASLPAGYALVPVNADGSVNVTVSKVISDMDVNVTEIAGHRIVGYSLPVDMHGSK